jgi:hypothetical protein
MNFANADTLAPIMKMRRSETVRAWGMVCSHHSIPKIDNLNQNNAGRENSSKFEEPGCMLLHDQLFLL